MMGKEGIGNVVSDIPGYMERLCRGRTGYEFIPKKKNALDLGALAGKYKKLQDLNAIQEKAMEIEEKNRNLECQLF